MSNIFLRGSQASRRSQVGALPLAACAVAVLISGHSVLLPTEGDTRAGVDATQTGLAVSVTIQAAAAKEPAPESALEGLSFVSTCELPVAGVTEAKNDPAVEPPNAVEVLSGAPGSRRKRKRWC